MFYCNIAECFETEDCANFHKYMYLCLKESLIPTPKKKKIQDIFRLRLQKI